MCKVSLPFCPFRTLQTHPHPAYRTALTAVFRIAPVTFVHPRPLLHTIYLALSFESPSQAAFAEALLSKATAFEVSGNYHDTSGAPDRGAGQYVEWRCKSGTYALDNGDGPEPHGDDVCCCSVLSVLLFLLPDTLSVPSFLPPRDIFPFLLLLFFFNALTPPYPHVIIRYTTWPFPKYSRRAGQGCLRHASLLRQERTSLAPSSLAVCGQRQAHST